MFKDEYLLDSVNTEELFPLLISLQAYDVFLP